MTGFLLSLALCVLAAGPQKAKSDSELMREARLRESYEAMTALKGPIDELAARLDAIRRTYAGRAEASPGGTERTRVRAELDAKLKELLVRRTEFRDLGTDQRLEQAVAMVVRFRDGDNEKANTSFQSAVRQVQIVQEFKQYSHDREAVLDDEQRAFDDSVRRWNALEASRTARRRYSAAGAAAAVFLGAVVVLARRRRPASPIPPGAARLGDWVLLRRGRPWSYGERWEAECDGTPGSLRLLDARLSSAAGAAERLERALAKTPPSGHPRCPSPDPVFVAGGRVAAVFAVPAGKPLSVWLEEGRAIDPKRAGLFLSRLGEVLGVLHARGAWHGALSPESVLVGPDGTVSLDDYGLARAFAECGLPSGGLKAYAAPEAEAGTPGPASDLYSAGVLLYELVTGRLPFEGANLAAIKAEKRFVPLSRCLPSCPPELDALVSSLLDPDPAKRPTGALRLA